VKLRPDPPRWARRNAPRGQQPPVPPGTASASRRSSVLLESDARARTHLLRHPLARPPRARRCRHVENTSSAAACHCPEAFVDLITNSASRPGASRNRAARCGRHIVTTGLPAPDARNLQTPQTPLAAIGAHQRERNAHGRTRHIARACGKRMLIGLAVKPPDVARAHSRSRRACVAGQGALKPTLMFSAPQSAC